jgi:alpha-amylase
MILGDATGKYVSLPTTVKFSPKHMTSYIALTLKNTLSAGKTPTVTLTATVPISGNAVFDYSGTTPTLKAASSGSSNSITVKPTGLSGIWFACIPARVSGKKLTISVTGSAGTLTREITVPSGKNLLAGQIAVLTVDMNPSTTVPVTGVSLNKTSLTLDAGKSETLTATVTPSNATDKSVTWSSSNTAVATVSSEGVVTGVKVGKTKITAISTAKKTVKKSWVIFVRKATTKIAISASSKTIDLASGNVILKLKGKVTPSDAATIALIFAGVIGLLWYFQYSKKYFWVSRIAMCISLGAGAGLLSRTPSTS